MATINEKMTGLADAIRSKAGVSGALSIDGMTAAVDGIIINPPSSGGADVSGVTATPADVLNTVKFVDNTGTLQSGTIATITPTLSDGVVTVPVGYNKTEQTFQVSGGGSVELSFITAEAGDIRSGKVGADRNGNPVTGTLVPESGGGGETQFYVCTGYDGVVEKIIVTAGAITDEMEEPVSLIGE